MFPYVLMAVGLLALAGGAWFFARAQQERRVVQEERQATVRLHEEAERETAALKKEAILEAKEEAHRIRQEAEQEYKERRGDLQRSERRAGPRGGKPGP